MKLILKTPKTIALVLPSALLIFASLQTVSAEIIFRRDAPLLKFTNHEIEIDYTLASTLYQLRLTDTGNYIIFFDEEYIEVPSLEAWYNDPEKLIIELKREREFEYSEPIIRPLDLIGHRVDW